MMTDLQVVPARRGRAVRVAKGKAIQIINTHGKQVLDTCDSMQMTCPNSCRWSIYTRRLRASLQRKAMP